jgi:hypothetical protein
VALRAVREGFFEDGFVFACDLPPKAAASFFMIFTLFSFLSPRVRKNGCTYSFKIGSIRWDP